MKVMGLVVAAGAGVRAGLDQPKQYASLGRFAVLTRALNSLSSHPRVDGCTVVIAKDHEPLFRKIVQPDLDAPVKIVHGGMTRLQSVRCGLEALAKSPPTHVLIHDGARPFLPEKLVDDIISRLDECDVVIPVLPVVDALWRHKSGKLEGPVNRSNKFRTQTPQGFSFDVYRDACRRYSGEADDDAAVAMAMGLQPYTVTGSTRNFKITFNEDLLSGEELIHSPKTTRTGFGYDVHRLEPGEKVILCGVEIPSDYRLAGHSDADVATHAITDAIYGGLGDGDIGRWFPPDDPRWKDADSMIFLRHAAGRATEFGYGISGVDCTIVCEQPKISPYSEEMCEKIATCLQIPKALVGVKATTTEGLGFTGRGEGILAHAIVSLTEI